MANKKTKKTKPTHKYPEIWLLLLAVPIIMVIFGLSGLNQVDVKEKTSEVVQQDKRKLKVAGQVLFVEVAATVAQKGQGLCCRNFLPANAGMLFVYDQPGNYSFWMKDTHIPLDIIWINSSKQIVYIEHAVQPSTYPQTFSSPTPAQYVLEVNAGYAKKHGLKIGDITTF